MSEEVYLTQEGFLKLKQELNHLKGPVREELTKRLKAAIEMGDLSENADFTSAKEEQGFIEGRILELEKTFKNVKIIENNNIQNGIVQIGSTIIVKEEDLTEETFYIVGSKEANPKNGKISYESPIGKALLDHKVGDIVRVDTPGGTINFRIMEIK